MSNQIYIEIFLKILIGEILISLDFSSELSSEVYLADSSEYFPYFELVINTLY